MTMDIPKMAQLIFLKRAHALALIGSAGQGAFRARHCKYAESASITPANINTHSLCSEILETQGTAPINPASDAPIPKVTSRAGRAQHSSVPMLVKRLKVGKVTCCHVDVSSFFDTVNTLYVIP